MGYLNLNQLKILEYLIYYTNGNLYLNFLKLLPQEIHNPED